MNGELTRHVAAGVVLLVAAGWLYGSTLALDVLSADNAELQLVATLPGLAHPPGFPLYTLLAHAFTRLPLLLPPALSVNLFSLVVALATLLLVCRAALLMGARSSGALVAGLVLAGATTFHAQAISANIRSLTAFWSAALLLAVLHYWQEPQVARRLARGPVQRILIALALVSGVAHHLSLAFGGLVVVALVAWRDRPIWRSWLVPLAWGSLALLPLLWLPWISAELRTPAAFLHYALGLGFGGDFFHFIQPAILLERLRVMGTVWQFQFHPLILIALPLGWLRLWRHNRPQAALLGGIILVHSFVTATYRAPQTVEYMLPVWVLAALLAAAALRPSRTWPHLHAPVTALLLLAALGQMAQRLPSFQSGIVALPARDYANTIFNHAPPGALVQANWHWATPLWYLQQIEQARPDLQVRYLVPGAEEYAESWLAAVEAARMENRPILTTNYSAPLRDHAPLPQPLGAAFLWPTEPLTALPRQFEPVTVAVEQALVVRGVQADRAQVAQWEPLHLTIAWEPLLPLPERFTLFAHLVAEDGTVHAQDDLLVEARAAGLTLTRFTLTPRPGTLPGRYQVLIGGYGHSALSATRHPLTELPVTPGTWRPISANRPPFPPVRADSWRLIGYDWDTTWPAWPRLYLHWETPEGFVTESRDGSPVTVAGRVFDVADCAAPCHYVPLAHGIVWRGAGALPVLRAGQTITRRHDFWANRPISHDLVVSNTLIGLADDQTTWLWQSSHDGIPALGAIPTLKWIAGSRVRDPHWLTVSADARPGQTIRETLLLYDAFTGQAVAVLDERLASLGQGILTTQSLIPNP